MHTDALKPIGTKVPKTVSKPCEPLCGPAVNFQSLFSELHQRQSMRLHRATVSYISVHLSLYYSTNGGCRVSPGTLVFPGFSAIRNPHMRGSEVRSLRSPDHHEPLCSSLRRVCPYS